MGEAYQNFVATLLPQINAQIEDYLTFSFTDDRKFLEQAMQYSFKDGGKRLRPLLVLATADLLKGEHDAALPLACAIEMIHTYSLIHDDLPAMDDDDFRRGKPTSHKAFGEDIAILAGDTLNTFAFEIMTRELTKSFSAEQVLRSVCLLAQACGAQGMAGGQVIDLKGHIDSGNYGQLKLMHALKTGALLKSCLTCTAALYDADQATQDRLTKLGDHIGLLFQIIDDILDQTADQATLGKTPNKDEAQGKLTYVSLFGLEKAKKLARIEFEKAIAVLAYFQGNDILSELITHLYQRTH